MADCECKTWGRDSSASVLLLEHHPACPHYKPEPEIRLLLLRMLNGIEMWAGDTDGVHPDLWHWYKAACYVVGQPSRVKECP